MFVAGACGVARCTRCPGDKLSLSRVRALSLSLLPLQLFPLACLPVCGRREYAACLGLSLLSLSLSSLRICSLLIDAVGSLALDVRTRCLVPFVRRRHSSADRSPFSACVISDTSPSPSSFSLSSSRSEPFGRRIPRSLCPDVKEGEGAPASHSAPFTILSHSPPNCPPVFSRQQVAAGMLRPASPAPAAAAVLHL